MRNTDHKTLKSLFNDQISNTKMQRWAVLLAEYGAVIAYRKDKHNIRADILSRIRHRQDPEIAVIDTLDYGARPVDTIENLHKLHMSLLELFTISTASWMLHLASIV